MHQRLSTTQRNAPMAIRHDDAFLLDLSHQFVHRVVLPTHLHGFCRTLLRTKPTLNTFRISRHNTIWSQLDSMHRTNGYTTLTTDTFTLLI